MNFIKKENLLILLQHHGYAVNKEEDIPEDVFQLFVTNIEAQLKEAIRVSLISADNNERKQLEESDLESVLNQLRIFPKSK